MVLEVEDPERTRAVLERNGVAVSSASGRLRVAPAEAAFRDQRELHARVHAALAARERQREREPADLAQRLVQRPPPLDSVLTVHGQEVAALEARLAEVQRMLAHPKATRAIEAFYRAWLDLSRFRELSRDVSLAIPEGGGSRIVPLTEIQGLDYERKVLSLKLTLELLEGDSVVARDSLEPVWARCC